MALQQGESTMKRNQLIAACLGSVFCLATQSWSTAAVAGQIAAAELKDTDLIAAIDKLAPAYTRATTDPIDIAAIDSGLENYNGATYVVGSTTLPITAAFDTASKTLTVLSSRGGAWRTYSLVLTGPWNATTTLNVPETVRDGGAAGSPENFNVILTKGTGTPPDLTADALGAWMAKCNITGSLGTTSAGVALTSTAAAVTGWSFKGYFTDNGGTAQAASLDPIGITVPLTVTKPGTTTGTTIVSNVTGLNAWNVTTSDGNAKRLTFNITGGLSIDMDFYPGTFGRTASISTGLVNSFALMPKRLDQRTGVVGFKNDLAAAVNKCLGMIASPAPASVQAGLVKIAADALNAANTTAADTPTTADTNKLGITGLATPALASVTWATDDTKLTLTGAYTGKAPLTFTGDLGAATSLTSASAPRVVSLSAKNGDTVGVVCYDATGYDASSAPAYPTKILAIDLYAVLNGVAAITTLTTAEAVTASQS